MRIGLVVESFDPRRGGVEQWTCQFTRWLLSKRHEVHVLARRFFLEATPPGMTAHTIEAKGRLAFAHEVARKLKSLDLDIVHDTGCGYQCDVLQPHGGSRRAAFEQNLKLMNPRWRTWKRRIAPWLPRHREFEALARRQYNGDDKLYIAISRMVERDLIGDYGVKPHQVRLVYNGVDCDRFSPALREEHRVAMRRKLRVTDDETLLLIVAHNFALKGVPTLIKATAQLVAEGLPARVAIAGGKRSGPYAQLATQLGIENRVTFMGPVDDPAPCYAAADVYVQPTFYDPCSLVVLEAFGCGLPVVTSRYNGAAELMTPGVEGEIVRDPADAAELAATLRPLFSADRREQMTYFARRLALRHTFEHNCRQVLAVYEEIHGKRTRRAA